MRLKQSFHICLWLHSQIHVQYPKDGSARFTAFSYLSHRCLCQTLSRDWPSLLSISRTRKHRLPLLSSFQKLLRDSPMWHIWKENFFPQILLAFTKNGSRPHQLSPNSYAFNKIPNVTHSLCDCWSFTELHKHQRIFLFSFHHYKTASAAPLLNVSSTLTSSSHLVIIYTEQWFSIEFTVLFIKLELFQGFKKTKLNMFWLSFKVSTDQSLPSELILIQNFIVALPFRHQDYCINQVT